MIEYVFAREIRRYCVTVEENKPLKTHPVFVTAYPWGEYVMSVQRGLHGLAKIEAVGLQFGRIALGHDFKRSGYLEERRNRKAWMEAELWLANRLIGDKVMREARRQNMDPRHLARSLGVSPRLVVVRYNHWSERRGQILHLPPPVARPADGDWCDEPTGPFF